MWRPASTTAADYCGDTDRPGPGSGHNPSPALAVAVDVLSAGVPQNARPLGLDESRSLPRDGVPARAWAGPSNGFYDCPLCAQTQLARAGFYGSYPSVVRSALV